MPVVEPCTATASLHDERRIDVLRSCFTDEAEFRASGAGTAKIGPFRAWPSSASSSTGIVQAQSHQRRHMLVSEIIEQLGSKSARILSYLMLTGFCQCHLHKGNDN